MGLYSHTIAFSPHSDNHCTHTHTHTHAKHFVQCTTYTFSSIWFYRGVSVKLHDSLNLVQGHASQGGELITVKACEKEVERDKGAHTSLQMPAVLFCMEEPLSMFILIQWDSCGHLKPAYAYASPRLSKPAPFIILQQPCSNWAASPPAVTHHLLHNVPEEIQMYLVRYSPVAAHQSLRLNQNRGSCAPAATLSWSQALLFPFHPVSTWLSLYPQWCGSPVMMWPIILTGDRATTLWRHCHGYLCPPEWEGY